MTLIHVRHCIYRRTALCTFNRTYLTLSAILSCIQIVNQDVLQELRRPILPSIVICNENGLRTSYVKDYFFRNDNRKTNTVRCCVDCCFASEILTWNILWLWMLVLFTGVGHWRECRRTLQRSVTFTSLLGLGPWVTSLETKWNFCVCGSTDLVNVVGAVFQQCLKYRDIFLVNKLNKLVTPSITST